MSKAVKIASVALVLVGILAAVFISMWLGAAIKTAIEQIGSRVTRTTVRVDDVDISLLRGLVQIKGLEIGNPTGFKAPTAIKLGTARIRVHALSALSSTVVIDEILVESPEITFEGFLTRSNLTTIQENVTASIPRSSSGAAKPAEGRSSVSSPSSSKKLLIREFTFRDGKVAAYVNAGLLGEKDLALVIPAIHLTDIGKETGGATPEQAVSAVFTAITRSTTIAVTDSIKHVGEAGKGVASQAAERVKSLLK